MIQSARASTVFFLMLLASSTAAPAFAQRGGGPSGPIQSDKFKTTYVRLAGNNSEGTTVRTDRIRS